MFRKTETFTVGAGIAFIVLAILRLTPFHNLTGKSLLYFGIAATMFVLMDFVGFITGLIFKKRSVLIQKSSIILYFIIVVLAAITVIVLPHTGINIAVKNVNTWGDALTMFGLGLAIVTLGIKSNVAIGKAFGQELDERIDEKLKEWGKSNKN